MFNDIKAALSALRSGQVSQPNPYPAIKSPIPTQDLVTKQTPGIQSPIPQSQVVPHAVGVSPFAAAMQQLGGDANRAIQGMGMQGFTNTVSPNAQVAQAAQIEPTQNPTPTPTPQESAPRGATDYEKLAANVFNQYGVPPAVGLGIWAAEGRGKTINPNNPYNIGAIDSNPKNANAYQFANPLQGTDEAAKFLSGQSQYQTPQVKNIFQNALTTYKKTNDQEAYLKAIASTYSSNKNYTGLIQNTPEFKRWSYDN